INVYTELESHPLHLTQRDRGRGRGVGTKGRVGMRRRPRENEVQSSPIRTRSSVKLPPNPRRSLPAMIPVTHSSGSLTSLTSGPPRKIAKVSEVELSHSNNPTVTMETSALGAPSQASVEIEEMGYGGAAEPQIRVRSSISYSPPSPTFKTVPSQPRPEDID